MSREFAVCAYCLSHSFWKDTDLPAVERANQDRYLRAGWSKQAVDWLCPACEQAGVAERARPEKQVWQTIRRPYLSFADFAGVCGLCRQDFVFSAREQRSWYEELGIPLEVLPNNCSACRETVRAQKEAQERLCRLLVDPQGPADFEAIGEIYVGAERYRKAVEALRRARNLQPDADEKRRLKLRIEELVELPDGREEWPRTSYSSNPHFFGQQRRQRAEAVRARRIELGDRWALG